MASLTLSSAFGIVGLIYANCINMSIRIVTSLLYAFQLEKNPSEALSNFVKDLISVDITFIKGLVTNILKKRKQE